MFYNNKNSVLQKQCFTTIKTTKSTKRTYITIFTYIKIYNNFLRERKSCQDQPQFEHEIFQSNVRTQNSKESNFQKKIKTSFVGNLNKNTSKEDLYELFSFWKYNIP